MKNRAVRFVNSLVVLTLLGGVTAGCGARRTNAVRNSLSRDLYIEPRSNAYDVVAWAKSRVARDRALGTLITELKTDLRARARFDFFPPPSYFPDVYHPRNWVSEDRAFIRDHLARILTLTRERRAFEDRSDLETEEARAAHVLRYFNAFENLPETAK